MKKIKDIKTLDKIKHGIRASQAILQYGVGAMVDFPDQTLMTAAPEYWSKEHLKHIHDERLEKVLGVNYFGMPDSYGVLNEWTIAYTRFPKWYFCPKCRRFQDLDSWLKEYNNLETVSKRQKDPYMKRPRCLNCKQNLVPARIVVACENGHIDDFPWIHWVHHRAGKEICNSPELVFKTGYSSTAGLEGVAIGCNTCRAYSNLSGAFNKDIFQEMSEKFGHVYRCSGNMPWKNQKEKCDKYPRTFQRGASSVYYPKVVSSLVIPPYSDKLNTLIEQSKEYKKCQDIISDYDEDERLERIKSRIDKWAIDISNEIYQDSESVKHILERKWLGVYNTNESKVNDEVDYRLEEYKALNGSVPYDMMNENEFVMNLMDITKYQIPGLKCVSLIHKIREVRALVGFSRINPPGDHGYVNIKDPSTKWYPAYEVRGEGIFIEFDPMALQEWENKSSAIVERMNVLINNYSNSYLGENYKRIITPRFILLHTIAHLLIRQFSFDSGYSVASLRERIYSNIGDNESSMSGIFIYTASGDSEGTLGGLVRLGYPDILTPLFKKSIEAGEICSNDPVCITSEGQGRDALNLAACHACTLLPETSCEEFNIFLDRGMVIGTIEDKSIGFFSDWIM